MFVAKAWGAGGATGMGWHSICTCLIELHAQVQVFSRVPVVVGTYINRVTCHPEDVSAKLWLACGAAGEVKYTAEQTTTQLQNVVPSVMAYESLIED